MKTPMVKRLVHFATELATVWDELEDGKPVKPADDDYEPSENYESYMDAMANVNEAIERLHGAAARLRKIASSY